MKLISMTDYCQQVSSEFMMPKKPFDKNYWFGKILNYSDFLKQLLELWMFVPCDDEGNVLVEPLHIELYEGDTYDIDCDKYQQAKERCLFIGFEFCNSQREGIESGLKLFVSPYNSSGKIYLTKKKESGYHSWFQLFTIEDLVQCELILTAN